MPRPVRSTGEETYRTSGSRRRRSLLFGYAVDHTQGAGVVTSVGREVGLHTVRTVLRGDDDGSLAASRTGRQDVECQVVLATHGWTRDEEVGPRVHVDVRKHGSQSVHELRAASNYRQGAAGRVGRSPRAHLPE